MPVPWFHAERYEKGGPVGAFDDDLPLLVEAHIGAVVCLLDAPAMGVVYRGSGIEFLNVPIPDGRAPTAQGLLRIIDFIDRQRSQGRAVAVHCEAGLGRTGTVLAGYLIAQGAGAAAAVQRIRQIEPAAIETRAQVEFLRRFAP